MVQSHGSRASRAAYALIELIVIVVVLGVVAAFAVPRLSGAATPTPSDVVAAHIETLDAQLALFRSRHGRYPTAEELTRPPLDANRGGGFGVLVDEGYLVVAPVNPRTQGDRVGQDWIYDPASGRVWAVQR